MSITVYELIQELVKFKPDTEVEFNFNGEFDVDADVKFDRTDNNDVQTVTVTAEFNDSVNYVDIDDNESRSYRPNVTINLEY